jgi:purine nucleoside phosphorylase
LLLTDIITLDNRLPDGDACTMFPEAHPDQGHLVLSEGLFSMALSAQLKELAAQGGLIERDRIVFGYVGGPRTKSAAENRMWRTLGAHVNSMTLAPEVILANELGIPCAGVVVGHKYSIPDIVALPDELAVTETLESSRDALQLIVRVFAGKGEPVPFANHLYRYDQEASRR